MYYNKYKIKDVNLYIDDLIPNDKLLIYDPKGMRIVEVVDPETNRVVKSYLEIEKNQLE